MKELTEVGLASQSGSTGDISLQLLVRTQQDLGI